MSQGSFSTYSQKPPKFDRIIKLADRNQNISPFSIFVDSVNASTRSANVRVSRYSSLFSDYALDATVTIIGLDYVFPFNEGDKIWLEVFYDRLGNAVNAKIKSGRQWTTQTTDPVSQGESIDVYPNQIELITRLDISNKLTELNAEYSDNSVIQATLIEQINERANTGLITEDEAAALITDINSTYEVSQENFLDLINNLGDFFQGSSALRKKQLRSFTLIGSASDTLDSLLAGEIIAPIPTLDPASTSTVVLPGQDNKFKIIQHANTDLLTVDLFYLDAFICKIPVPHTKGLY